MKRTTSIFLFISLMFGQVFGQTDTTSVYKNLKTKKFYSVSSIMTSTNGQNKYEVNGIQVDKSTFKKYQKTWKNMENCCPCILKSFDENDVLFREAVSCTDCGVGWIKEFFPSGELKLTGFYKENPTDNWNDLWDREFCSIKNGKWTYFNAFGDTLYSEFWENGEFIKQVPEQDSMELWEIEIYLQGIKYTGQKIDIAKITEFKIVAKFKNGNTSENFRIETKVPTNYNVKFKSSTTPNPFTEINANKIFEDAKVPENKRTSLKVLIYLDNEYVQSFIIRLNL